MADVTVRRAGVEDAAAIAAVQVTGWHEAYTGRMPQSILDGLDVARSTRGWRRLLEDDNDPERGELWVAERDGEVIGFVASGRNHDEDAVPERREVFAIYVLAAHYGSGAGQSLLDAAIGDHPASLWVLADNPRAHAFYARNGFVADGSWKDDDQWGEPVREVRLVRG